MSTLTHAVNTGGGEWGLSGNWSGKARCNYGIPRGFTEEMLTLPACCAACLAAGIHAAALVAVPRRRKVRVFAQDLLTHR